MRRILLATSMGALLCGHAHAQQAPLPPNVQALQQTVLKLTGEALEWQTQAITLQAQVAELQKQLAAGQNAPKETPKP